LVESATVAKPKIEATVERQPSSKVYVEELVNTKIVGNQKPIEKNVAPVEPEIIRKNISMIGTNSRPNTIGILNDLILHLGKVGRNTNPHYLSEAARDVMHTRMAHHIFKDSKVLYDRWGNARTQKLFKGQMIHINRPEVAIKDMDRINLLNKLGFNKSKGAYKPLKGGKNYCVCLDICSCVDADVYFYNDCIYYEGAETEIKKLISNKKKVFAILHVFDPEVGGSEIGLTMNGNYHCMGSWYRNKNETGIVYSPFVDKSDLQQGYEHPDVLNALYTHDEVRANGLMYITCERMNWRGESYIGIQILQDLLDTRTSQATVRIAKNLKFLTESKDLEAVLRCNKESDIKPNPPFELYHKVKKSQHKVSYVDKLQITRAPYEHGHQCEHCGGLYLHIHPSKYIAKTDVGSYRAKHKQFYYDCPYVTCDNYMHLSCEFDKKLCPKPEFHDEALKIHASKFMDIVALNPTAASGIKKEIIEINTHIDEPIIVPNHPIVDEVKPTIKITVERQEKHENKEGTSFFGLENVITRIYNKDLKSYEHFYYHKRGLTVNKLIIGHDTIMQDGFTYTYLLGDFVCSMTDMSKYVKFIHQSGMKCDIGTAVFRELSNRIITNYPTMTFEQGSINGIIKLVMDVATIQYTSIRIIAGSKLTKTYNAMKNGTTEVDHGFIMNWWYYGFKKATSLAINWHCCGEYTEIGNLDNLADKRFGT
jgi:hypothetical protein